MPDKFTLEGKHFDPESYPTRCLKSSVITELKKRPTVTVEVDCLGEKMVRKMWPAKYLNQDTLIDSSTGSVYVNGKCLSTDQLQVVV